MKSIGAVAGKHSSKPKPTTVAPMAAQKQGMVFYQSSSSGYCVYYLSRNSIIAGPLKLTTGMPFLKAAKIVHELNRQLFQKAVVNDEEVRAVVRAYLTGRGVGEYVLNRD